jgi:hypothetical protein
MLWECLEMPLLLLLLLLLTLENCGESAGD